MVFVFHTIWTSPALDCSSTRPRPSFVSQSRPDAPVISAEPVCPRSAPEGKRLFVNVICAVTPSGAPAESASWIAWARGFGGRRGPTPARGDGERCSASGEREHADDENDEASGRESAQEIHDDPFCCSLPSVVAPDSENSLRTGSSIVKRAPCA